MTYTIHRRSAVAALAAMTATVLGWQNAFAQTGTDEANRAPFGLTWGMSADDLRQQGVTLTREEQSREWGASYTATKLPKVLSDTEAASLAFGHDDRLFRIVAIGKTNGPDPYGGATLARYRELVEALSSRYGKGVETDQRDQRVWKEAHEYIMSLHQGRARRFTNFSTPTTNVEVSVRTLGSDKSFYVIIFTSVAGEKAFEASKRTRERDAL